MALIQIQEGVADQTRHGTTEEALSILIVSWLSPNQSTVP